jgi:hypothetical protein
MDSIDGSEIHHFETALNRSLFKGMKQKKRYTYPYFDLPFFPGHWDIGLPLTA